MQQIIVCEECGEILEERTKDKSGLYVCRSKRCGIAVRRGVKKNETGENKIAKVA